MRAVVAERPDGPDGLVVRATRLERVENEVLIVSLDRLVPALRVGAGTSHRPEFLVGETSEI